MKALFSFYFLLALTLLAIGGCTNSSPSGGSKPAQAGDAAPDKDYYDAKRLRYENHIYEDSIRTVQFYPLTDQPTAEAGLPVLYLKQTLSLMLEFDEMGSEYSRFYAKIIHCDRDWTPSRLMENEYLDTYNEFTIEDYQMSSGTRRNFVHYRFELPQVKKSGNYLLKVYRASSEEEVVITRRYVVYDTQVGVKLRPRFSRTPKYRDTYHQIDFSIFHPEMNLINPRSNVHVVLRQNGRWDNAIYDLKPKYLRPENDELQYQFFHQENNFPGGNEFRTLDTRSYQYKGRSLAHIQRTKDSVSVVLNIDEIRNKKAYNNIPDINGEYIINRRQVAENDYTSDYLATNFRLESPYPSTGQVYVFGALSDWETDPRFRMHYDQENRLYRTKVWLKQGYYNYKYVVKRENGSIDEILYEGTHADAENMYDVLVYYRPPGGRYDHVIGYSQTHFFGDTDR